MANNRRRKNNGVKIYCTSTVVLFAAVILLSKLSIGTNEVPDSKDKPSKPSAQTSQTVTTDETTPEETAVSDAADIGEITDDIISEETVPEETSAPLPEPVPDPDEADNLWALFLVNANNPVSIEYCESIETAKVYESWREYYMDARAADYMKQMLDDAAKDDIQLIVMSAHRTVEYQQNNFDNSVKDRMENRGMSYDEAYADTLKEVQLPGYSEHNAGLAADIMSDEYTDMNDDGFRNTNAYDWLTHHAADYGFILRYPEGKESSTGIIYEPWHYRFVGKYYAHKITESGLSLEEYFSEMNWTDPEGKAVYHIAGE